MIRVLVAALAVVALLVSWLVSERGDLQRGLQAAEEVAARLEAERHQLAQSVAARDAVDQKNTQELQYAHAENDRLRADVAAGHRRLLVKASCPAVSADSGSAGLADAGSAELAADARPDYLAIRDELALSRQMILGLQQYVREVCQRERR